MKMVMVRLDDLEELYAEVARRCNTTASSAKRRVLEAARFGISRNDVCSTRHE